MGYSTGSHTLFHHRYHIVWAPKYRNNVLHGEVRTRVRHGGLPKGVRCVNLLSLVENLGKRGLGL